MACAVRSAKRIVKLAISALFWGGACVARFMRRLSGKEVPASCVILYYHSVPAEHRQRFARQMDKLARLTKPIKIDDHPGPEFRALSIRRLHLMIHSTISSTTRCPNFSNAIFRQPYS